MNMLELIGLAYIFQIMMLYILTVLELNTFLKRLKTLLGINKKSIRNESMQTKIFRIHANNSIMCGYFCIGFIIFMLVGKNLLIILLCFHLMVLKKMTI